MTRTDQGFPKLSEPIVDPRNGLINQTWLQLLITLWNRTGGPSGSTDRFETNTIQGALSDIQNRLIDLETPPPETSEFLDFAQQFQDVVSSIPALRHELLEELDKRLDAATLLVPPQVLTTSSGGTGGADNYNIVSLGGNTTGTLATFSATTLLIAGGNNITLSQNGASITISGANTGTAGDNYNIISASGNTTGTLTSFSQGTFVLAGGNNITLSQSSNTLTIVGPNTVAQTVQTYNVVSASGNTSGTLTSFTTGTIVFAGGNNITLSQSSNTITISGPNTVAQSVQTYNVLSASGNTSGTLTTFSTGTLVLAGGNNITLSQSSNTITISAGNGGGAGVTLSAWEPIFPAATNALNFGIGTINLHPFVLPNPVSASLLNMLGTFDATTNTNSGQVGFSSTVGIYSRIASNTASLTLVISQSYTGGASYTSNSNGASFNGSTISSAGIIRNSINALRQIGFGISRTLDAGEYFLGVVSSSSSAGSAGAMSVSGPVLISANLANPLVPFVLTNASTVANGFLQGGGTYSASSAGLPNSAALSDFRTTGSAPRRAYFNLMVAQSL